MLSQRKTRKKRNKRDDEHDRKVERKIEISLLLHNIRSTHNTGSIFRTADAVGVSKIYLSGYTPAPIDRFGRLRKDIAKVSLGAEKVVVWESIKNVFDLIKKMKKDKVKMIGLEQDKRSVDYIEAKIAKRNLLIIGSEVGGIEKEILSLCDEIAEIPMRGEKESLNVSVATGIFLFSI